MNRQHAIALRSRARTTALARVGADAAATNPTAPSKSDEGLMGFFLSTTGLLIATSVVGLWLVTRST